jgi:signal transduction histidine kinase
MIVDLHHGRIAVESVEGEGSCFTVRLPLYVDDQRAADRATTGEPAEA